MAFNLVDKIKALFGDPTIQEVIDTNRSINYYRPDWVEPEEQEKDYKKWKEYVTEMYKSYPKITSEFPSEYEFRNITDPYEVKRSAAGKVTGALTNILKNPSFTEGPSIEFNPDTKVNPNILRHELFHAKNTGEDYWQYWNRLTQPMGQSYYEFGNSLLRGAGSHKYNTPNDRYSHTIGNNLYNAYMNNPSMDIPEELGAYMMQYGKDILQKPSWMTDRQYQIMLNFINTRMGWE